MFLFCLLTSDFCTGMRRSPRFALRF